ncbi:MAG: hypothetical protein ABSF71_36625 [Terriglobia bacterium]|jgi:hypothetical protein
MSRELIVPVILGNILAIVLLGVAARAARVARYILGVGFISGSI